MDIYLEYMVKQKYSAKSAILCVLAYLAAIALTMLTFFGMFYNSFLLRFSFPLIIGYFIGAWWITQRFNIEYEYILTNDELDVDKIMSGRARRRMLTVSVKNFDKFGAAEGKEFEMAMNDSSISVKFDASESKYSEGRYFAIFNNKRGERMMLIFNPTQKMLEAFRRYNPSKVILDD